MLSGGRRNQDRGYHGSYVALWMSASQKKQKLIAELPLKSQVAAISVGIVGGEMLLDFVMKKTAGGSGYERGSHGARAVH